MLYSGCKQSCFDLTKVESNAEENFTPEWESDRLAEDITGASDNLVENGLVRVGHDLGLDACACVEVSKQMVGGFTMALNHLNIFNDEPFQ